MKVNEFMSKDVVSVSPDTPVIEIARIMKDKNIGSVPVVKDNKVIGIVTDRDIVLRDVAMAKDINKVTAKEVMTYGVSTVTPETEIHEAARIMSQKQIRRLPVVENNRLVGMLALGDVAVHSKLEDDAGEALSDISKPVHTIY